MPMKEPSPFAVRAADWVADGPALRAIRTEVFVEEQQVPVELEWDADDERARHVLALTADGSAVGTGRLLPDGRIGRMAVLRPWRGKGAGAALLTELLRIAQAAGLDDLALHAQIHAIGFYVRFGFQPEGETFLEAGIPHRAMRLWLA
jgi:predicted GNAT family N-acyltransferase